VDTFGEAPGCSAWELENQPSGGLRPESMTNGSGAAGIGVGFGNDQVLMPLRRVYDVR
jgi:hypothetical protein